MAYKIEDAFQRYLNRECTVFTVDEEFEGMLSEVGEDFILLKDDNSDYIINIPNITGVEFENDD